MISESMKNPLPLKTLNELKSSVVKCKAAENSRRDGLSLQNSSYCLWWNDFLCGNIDQPFSLPTQRGSNVFLTMDVYQLQSGLGK